MKMELPTPVAQVLETLEAAGFASYAVGGCVRDACLGLTPQDYDLCTQALPEQIESLFSDRDLDLTGVDHGTVRIPTAFGPVETTTLRQEGSYEDSRHPGWVRFVKDIRLDLERRDFTVNAMAYSPSRGLQDPFGGQQDLQNGILRTVGDPELRFREDALRILRALRFAVRFHLQVEEKTLEAMNANRGLLDRLSGERIFEEVSKVLPLMDHRELQTFAPILSQVIPELGPMVGFDQHSPHHRYDLYTHTALVTEQVPPDLVLRWAALLHDIGKVPTFTRDETGRGHFYGHAPAGAEMARKILVRLKAPRDLREPVVKLIGEHMERMPQEPGKLKRRIRSLGWELSEKLFYLQRADLMSKGTDTAEDRAYFPALRQIMDSLKGCCLEPGELKITGEQLMALGFRGREIGDGLEALLELVMDDEIPNEEKALLEKAEQLRN